MRFLIAFFCLTAVFSCSRFRPDENRIPIARANDAYLYLEDVSGLIPENATETDSMLRLRNIIDQWATQKLLIDQAKLNISIEKQNEFRQLVEQYEADLFTKAYLEGLVKQNIDTVITMEEAKDVYEKNLESFRLNEELIKLRYVNVDSNYTLLSEVNERLKRFDSLDKRVLDSISIQFRSFSLNDSIWIKVSQAVERIAVINPRNRSELLKKSNFIELKDSLGLYLMHVSDVLERNQTAPLEYVMPTIRQIVLNKRKIEFIKQLEKDITKDAIQNGQYEIFE